ncbi:MAG: 16S rRNA (cytosine(1402)-N(4))-methyltransferase RsmH [Demequinaceae bacterium]|nr:16S rRNA (cytosine(1402)-N(4))-methyltransferase RsmH [Demequinaceae bacterium]
MVDRSIDLLAPALDRQGSVAIDGTLGLGGHTEALLRSCPEVTVIGIDRDADALALATARLASFGDRFVAHHSEFDDIEGALARIGAPRADGVLLDLGVSSLQIDEVGRGFSYSQDAPLDMRMDREAPRTAADILREESEEEIARILKEYGEERYAKKIARAIVRRRVESPITRSGALADIVRASIPAAARAEGGNPAKRSFQALRIAVNDELGLLSEALPRAIGALAVGGRIVVLSYHSLEDRLVKHALAEGVQIRAPHGMPVIREEDRPYLRLLVKGAEKASESEVARNPRSRPVRLRAAERIRETPRERRAARASHQPSHPTGRPSRSSSSA